MTMTDAAGQTRSVRSNPFGYYKFDDIQAGQGYILTVNSKSYQFVPQFVSVLGSITDLDLRALP